MASASKSPLAAFWLALACSGCGPGAPDPSSGDAEAWPAPLVETSAPVPAPFRVGVVVDRSGPGKRFGDRFAAGFSTGLQHGEGPTPEVRCIDDRGRATGHLAAVRELLRGGCVAISGGQRAIGGIVGSAALADSGVLWWAPLSGMGGTATLPANCPLRPDLAAEVEWLLARLQQKGTDLGRIAMVVAADAHGQELLWHAAAALRRRGSDGPRWQWRVGGNADDIGAVEADLRGDVRPSVMVCGLDDDGTVAAISAFRRSRSVAPVVCLSGVAIDEVADELGAAADDVVWLQCVPPLAADDPVGRASQAAGVADAPAFEGWLAGRALRVVLGAAAASDRAAVVGAAAEARRRRPDLASWARAFGATFSGGPFWSVAVVDGTLVPADVDRAPGGR